MTKITLLIVIVTTTVLCSWISPVRRSRTATIDVILPSMSFGNDHKEWKPSFFSALEERIKRVKLLNLESATLREKDLEMRFWYDGRPYAINGFVIHRLNGRWSAIGIRQVSDEWPSAVKRDDLGQPKSGWDVLWTRLVALGLLTLPDGSATKCKTEVLDGGAFVVETKTRRTYRTYRYGNPQVADCDEAKRIVSIEGIIADEFRLRRSQK